MCGLRAGGAVECWGSNDEGQWPAAGAVLDAIAAGELMTCGITAANRVSCWGNGFSGNGPSGEFTQVDVNTDFACGVRVDGTALCWDDVGELPLPPT